MNTSEMRILFQNGVLRDATIQAYMGGWVVIAHRHDGSSITLEKAKPEPGQSRTRFFKTLKGAWESVTDIGFRDARVTQKAA